MKVALTSLALVLAMTGCSGVRQANGVFTAHAESFRVFGYPIPADDQAAATKMVPAGAQVNTVASTPADWTSVWGVLGNIFWFHQTMISGTVSK